MRRDFHRRHGRRVRVASARNLNLWSPCRRYDERARGTEAGFTLIELLIVSVILPLIMGAIAVGFIQILRLQGGVGASATDSADAQSVSSTLDQDLKSAAYLTTSAIAPQCGSSSTQTQLLGMEWNLNHLTGSYQTIVSYVRVHTGSTYTLLRLSCTSGASATPTSTTAVSFDIAAGQLPPTVTPTSSNTAAVAGWTSSLPVTGVTFAITEPGSKYTYTLVGLPGANGSTPSPTGQSTVPTPTTNCGFATPGTGTYASTLCFVDFSPYVASAAASPNCQKVVAAITNSPFTMSFCLSVSGTGVYAHIIPTYFAPPTSEAFLGNNGFYTGIPGDPALYQTGGGSTTLNITNIQVLGADGSPATGWEFVSGDAESTDIGESLTWSTCPSIGTACAVSASSPVLNLMADSATSAIGNACAGATPSAPVELTGVGTNLVQCAAAVSSDKTGTVMLEAADPSTLTVNMVGTGLQAAFIGLLLP